MAKFTITTLEYWSQDVEVEADNLDEAVSKILNGDCNAKGEPEFLQRDSEADWWKYRGEYIGDLPVPLEDIIE